MCLNWNTVVIDSDEYITSKEEFESFEDVGKAFTNLQVKMTNLLKRADHSILRNACIAQKNSPNGVYFSQDLETQLNKTENVETMLDVLIRSSHWSWIDIRLLETMVVASLNEQAKKLLNNYKSVIFKKKLIEIFPRFNLKIKKNPKQYQRVITKFKMNPNELTADHLLECQKILEENILDIGQGKSLLGSLSKGCIEIHWYIPSTHVKKTDYCFDASNFQLLYLQIGTDVVYDPFNKHDSMVELPESDKIG